MSGSPPSSAEAEGNKAQLHVLPKHMEKPNTGGMLRVLDHYGIPAEEARLKVLFMGDNHKKDGGVR